MPALGGAFCAVCGCRSARSARVSEIEELLTASPVCYVPGTSVAYGRGNSGAILVLSAYLDGRIDEAVTLAQQTLEALYRAPRPPDRGALGAVQILLGAALKTKGDLERARVCLAAGRQNYAEAKALTQGGKDEEKGAQGSQDNVIVD